MKRLWRSLSRACFIAVVLVAIAANILMVRYAATVQRVTPYPQELRDMTGQIGAEEGEPVRALVFDRSSILAEKAGMVFIDSSKSYPIQIKLFASGAGGIAAALFILGTGSAFLARRKSN